MKKLTSWKYLYLIIAAINTGCLPMCVYCSTALSERSKEYFTLGRSHPQGKLRIGKSFLKHRISSNRRQTVIVKDASKRRKRANSHTQNVYSIYSVNNSCHRSKLTDNRGTEMSCPVLKDGAS